MTLNKNFDIKKLSNAEIHSLENYTITNADGVIGIYDYIHLTNGKPTVKYEKKQNIYFNPIQPIKKRAF